jgi:hypothetical protein
MPARLGKAVLAVFLAAVAIGFAVLGSLTIAAIFTDAGDSEDSVYIFVGSIELAIAVIFALAAALTLFGPHHRWHWLVLAGLAFVAAMLPYEGLVGSAGYVANIALGLLAVGSVAAYLITGQATTART